jgi:hypothetical protein
MLMSFFKASDLWKVICISHLNAVVSLEFLFSFTCLCLWYTCFIFMDVHVACSAARMDSLLYGFLSFMPLVLSFRMTLTLHYSSRSNLNADKVCDSHILWSYRSVSVFRRLCKGTHFVAPVKIGIKKCSSSSVWSWTPIGTQWWAILPLWKSLWKMVGTGVMQTCN